MKKLTVLFFSALFIIACKNVEQYRAPIEALSTDWERASANINELSSMLSGATTMLATLKDSMVVDPKAKLKPETKSTLDSMMEAFMAQFNGLSSITPDVAAFANSWGEMGGKLNKLKEGLAAKKLEGDVMAQINELKAAVQDANTKTDEWKSRVEGAKTTALSAYDQFKQALMAK